MNSNLIASSSAVQISVETTVLFLQGEKEKLINQLAEFKGNVIADGNEKTWKSIRAGLVKERKAYDEERKSLDKAWKAQILPVVEEYKSIDSLYAETISDIDGQLKEIEEKRKAEKMEEIKRIFAESVVEKGGDVGAWLKLEDCFKSSWLNKTYSTKDIAQDIEDMLFELQRAHDTIKAMHHPYEEQGLAMIRDGKSLTDAISKMSELAEQERLILERKAIGACAKDAVDAVPEFLAEFEELPNFETMKTFRVVLEAEFEDAETFRNVLRASGLDGYVIEFEEVWK